jgi:hypothetical protein
MKALGWHMCAANGLRMASELPKRFRNDSLEIPST